MFSTAQVEHLLDIWRRVAAERVFELAREFFPDLDDGDIFQEEDGFESFVRAWTDALSEARTKLLCVLKVAVED